MFYSYLTMSATLGAPAGTPGLTSHFEHSVWRSMSDRSLEEQVFIAEKAVSRIPKLKDLVEKVLSEHKDKLPDAEHLLESIGKRQVQKGRGNMLIPITERDLTMKSKSPILVGVIGGTGAGKSTLIK